MKTNVYGSIRIIDFNQNTTEIELKECGEILSEWADDNREYAIISLMSSSEVEVRNIRLIISNFYSIDNSKLHIYGIASNPLNSFIAKVVGNISGIHITEMPDFGQLIE